ncbi:MAG: SGNH/GDSL hydrolase family protein [Oscillospiraceae bacterium]
MKTILCFGDSNTFGLDPASGGRFGRDTRWTGLLSKKLGEDFYVVEEGICGRTTVFEDRLRPNRNGSAALPMLLESHLPDILVIMLGTNDCKTFYNATADSIAEGARILVRQAQNSAAHPKIILISPIFLAEGVGQAGFDEEFCEHSVEVSRGLPTAFKKVAQAERCGFLAASDYAEPSVADREHMDASSHKRLAEAVFSSIAAAV